MDGDKSCDQSSIVSIVGKTKKMERFFYSRDTESCSFSFRFTSTRLPWRWFNSQDGDGNGVPGVDRYGPLTCTTSLFVGSEPHPVPERRSGSLGRTGRLATGDETDLRVSAGPPSLDPRVPTGPVSLWPVLPPPGRGSCVTLRPPTPHGVEIKGRPSTFGGSLVGHFYFRDLQLLESQLSEVGGNFLSPNCHGSEEDFVGSQGVRRDKREEPRTRHPTPPRAIGAPRREGSWVTPPWS